MFRCWDIRILSFASVENSWKFQTSISPQRKMIETWFKNWQAQLIVRKLNNISLNNFVSALGAYYDEYGTFHFYPFENVVACYEECEFNQSE